MEYWDALWISTSNPAWLDHHQTRRACHGLATYTTTCYFNLYLKYFPPSFIKSSSRVSCPWLWRKWITKPYKNKVPTKTMISVWILWSDHKRLFLNLWHHFETRYSSVSGQKVIDIVLDSDCQIQTLTKTAFLILLLSKLLIYLSKSLYQNN